MATSTQITNTVLKQANPAEAEWKIWESTRYLVAQIAPAADSQVTEDGWYKGRQVFPGPKADPRFGVPANVNDYSFIKNNYYVRFIDSQTTERADANIGQALYTVMTDAEADEYEDMLRRTHNLSK